jgi:hypothetical protein
VHERRTGRRLVEREPILLVFENVLDGPEAIRAQLLGALAGRFQAIGTMLAAEAHEAQTRAVALLGMRSPFQDAGDEPPIPAERAALLLVGETSDMFASASYRTRDTSESRSFRIPRAMIQRVLDERAGLCVNDVLLGGGVVLSETVLKTWWCVLGQQRRSGGGPFLLHEVVAAVDSDSLPDPAIAATIQAMRREWETGKLSTPTLKLVRHGEDFQIADANKRAAALLDAPTRFSIDPSPKCRQSRAGLGRAESRGEPASGRRRSVGRASSTPSSRSIARSANSIYCFLAQAASP